jgi:AAA domain-containing protein
VTNLDPEFAEFQTPLRAVSEPVSENKRPLTRHSDTSDGSDAVSQGESVGTDLLAGLRDGLWLDRQHFPPLKWAVPGLLPEGFSLVVAPPKAGKSWLVLGWLLGLAAGGAALGTIRIPDPADVLYLALEDGDRRMQDRARILLGDHDPIPARFRYLTRLPAGLLIPVLAEYMQRYPETRLIVLDTLGKVMPDARQGETTYARDYRVGGHLKAIADAFPGLAIIAVHHDRKASSDDFVDSVSGTHGLAGAADAVLVLQRARHSKDAVLRVTGRDVPEEAYAIRLAGIGSWQLDGRTLAEAAANVHDRDDETRLSDSSAQVMDFIRGGGTTGRTAKEIRDKFGESAERSLSRRIADGSLVKPARGVYVDPTATASEVSEVSEPQVRALFSSDTINNSVSEVSERYDY